MSMPERVALEGDYDAVVVGAGFGGLYALHRLRELGLSVIGFEAAPRSAGHGTGTAIRACPLRRSQSLLLYSVVCRSAARVALVGEIRHPARDPGLRPICCRAF